MIVSAIHDCKRRFMIKMVPEAKSNVVSLLRYCFACTLRNIHHDGRHDGSHDGSHDVSHHGSHDRSRKEMWKLQSEMR